MSGCDQESITDRAFSHLKGIHTLSMLCCTQTTITDKAFSYLNGIHTLDMRYCNQQYITNKAVSNLTDIHTLRKDQTFIENVTLSLKKLMNRIFGT